MVVVIVEKKRERRGTDHKNVRMQQNYRERGKRKYFTHARVGLINRQFHLISIRNKSYERHQHVATLFFFPRANNWNFFFLLTPPENKLKKKRRITSGQFSSSHSRVVKVSGHVIKQRAAADVCIYTFSFSLLCMSRFFFLKVNKNCTEGCASRDTWS